MTCRIIEQLREVEANAPDEIGRKRAGIAASEIDRLRSIGARMRAALEEVFATAAMPSDTAREVSAVIAQAKEAGI